ncbi:hypothetical protein [Candidatus Methylocalor cossyra]|uniref:hypothetical protein n=1 Tax=Candidatus Methylocalor cossyra TaxID=3108543 RepID=UPI0032B2D33E
MPSIILWLGLLCLVACRSPTPMSIPAPMSQSEPGLPAGRADLAVTAIALSAPSVRRHQAFAVTLEVSNRGGREAVSFEVEAQANRDAGTTVFSYPIGGRERARLGPGETAAIRLARPEGLPMAGVYTIMARLRLTEFEPAETTDRVDPRLPAARLVVRP